MREEVSFFVMIIVSLFLGGKSSVKSPRLTHSLMILAVSGGGVSLTGMGRYIVLTILSPFIYWISVTTSFLTVRLPKKKPSDSIATTANNINKNFLSQGFNVFSFLINSPDMGYYFLSGTYKLIEEHRQCLSKDNFPNYWSQEKCI